jgi:PPE-repeat protein
MTAPVWMASPPEVHSALLSSGPGPGGLLAASASWSSLSATYASVADELSAILAAVQAGAWQGPSAEQYVAAHVPYLAWLMRASADSAALAARHETAATAYTSALAAMPTLPELAANHAIHAVLLATNFFSINTIPIALNEADYVRMWVQAATTMSTYQAVSAAVVSSAPQTDPAPQIVNSRSSAHPADGEFGGGGSDSGDSGLLDIVDNDAGDPYDLSWWVNRFLEVPQTLWRDAVEFPQNPSLAIEQLQSDIPGLIADETGHAAEAYQAFGPEIQALASIAPLANVGFLGGFAGLSGLAGIQPGAAPAVAAAPLPETPGVPIGSGSPAVSVASAPAPVPSSASVSVPAPAPAAAPATGAPPPPPAGIEGAAYPYLVGGPTMGAGMGISSSAQRKAPEPDIATVAAAAAASARDKQRARRRHRAAMNDQHRGYRYEFLVSDGTSDPFPKQEDRATAAAASAQRAGALGFAGTSRRSPAEAGGLATLAGDEFGGGPSVPMVPRTWDHDREPGEGDGS